MCWAVLGGKWGGQARPRASNKGQCAVCSRYCPEQAPEDKEWAPATFGSSSLASLSLGTPRKENSLVKAVGSGHQPVGVDEDSSTEVQATVQQACLPRPPASLCVLAAVYFPNCLWLPAHCGDTSHPVRDTRAPSMPPQEGPSSISQVGRSGTKGKGPGSNGRVVSGSGLKSYWRD